LFAAELLPQRRGLVNNRLSRNMMLAASALLATCVLGGCATKRALDKPNPGSQITSYASNGEVKAEVIEAPERARYKATKGVTFISPEPWEKNAVPTYPPALLIKRLDPVEVVVRVIVNTTGSVDSATIASNG
jgi:outer membrane biosynthesis protein TonB